MEQRAGAQIGQRAFIQAAVLLLILMIGAGLLTRLVPAGSYARVEQDGREVILPDSFQFIERPDYPFWRWLTAPFEVLGGPDGVTILVIIVFLMMVGVSFAVLDRSGILKAALARLVSRFGSRKYLLLLVIALFFMCLGAFFGIFEEIVPLVPLMIALSYSLGWDTLVGLGMSVLATNMGFSAAITNPFTIGVAQQLAGLPAFSGAWLRILIFLSIYIVFAVFLSRYARKVDRNAQASPVYAEDRIERQKYASVELSTDGGGDRRMRRASVWLLACLLLILAILFASPFIPALTQLSLPLIGLLFLAGGLGAGLLSGCGGQATMKSAAQGAVGIAPAIPLILMAASVKYIAAQGGILDTLLHTAAGAIPQSSPFAGALMIYGSALFFEFFIGSASAKAFLLMPILIPLSDLIGVTRQVTVTAYCFGDGFSNLAYPTNPVLLVVLGLTVVSYPKWLKWTLGLWGWVLLVTVAFLAIAVAIGYGPF